MEQKLLHLKGNRSHQSKGYPDIAVSFISFSCGELPNALLTITRQPEVLCGSVRQPIRKGGFRWRHFGHVTQSHFVIGQTFGGRWG